MVQDVNFTDMKNSPVALFQTDYRKAYRIRATGCTNGEDSMFLVLQEWFTQELKPLYPVHMIKENQMRESFNILQTISKFGENLHSANTILR